MINKFNFRRFKMARTPRIVVAGQPLHVIQRGNDLVLSNEIFEEKSKGVRLD
jgi:hypothetical protein